MADADNDLSHRGERQPDTWLQLREAVATWTGTQLADQIQRTGPSLREALHPEELTDSEPDALFDFEAEP